MTAGNATEDGEPNGAPTWAPLAPQIALAATLVVHPLFTNRAKSSLELTASDEALRFLRHVLQTLGPVNANFAEAFAFHSSRSRGRIGRMRGDCDPAEEDVAGTIYAVFANDNSLFSQVQDIWQVVGWALNCSVLWRSRWLKWKLFLEFYLDVLEEYLKIEPSTDRPSSETADFASSFQLNGAQTRTALRAVFASGNGKSTNEFGEVFKDETKTRKVDTGGWNRQIESADDEDTIDHQNEEGYDAVTDDESLAASQNGDGPARSVDATILRARILSLVRSLLGIPSHADPQDVRRH